MRRYVLTFATLLYTPANAHDVQEGQQHWPEKITSIYWSDGDSGWINGKRNGFAFRLNDIDAPETAEDARNFIIRQMWEVVFPKLELPKLQ